MEGPLLVVAVQNLQREDMNSSRGLQGGDGEMFVSVFCRLVQTFSVLSWTFHQLSDTSCLTKMIECGAASSPEGP